MKQIKDFPWIYFLCVIFSVYADQERFRLYSNPCPQLFRYVLVPTYGGYECAGIVQIERLTLEQPIKLEVHLSLPAKLTSDAQLLRSPNSIVYQQHLGSIQLHGSADRIVWYKINFPSQNPLPTLVQVAVNGEVLCTGPAIGPVVKLEYPPHAPFVAYKSDSGFEYQTLPPPPKEQLQSLVTQATSTHQPTTDGFQHECGSSHVKNNFRHLIVGGDTVKRGAWPWLVAVFVNGTSGPTFNCAGSLISRRTILTAAHCLRTSTRPYPPREVLLYLGRHNILDASEAGVKAVTVKKIIIHSNYLSRDDSFDADIAIIIMRERIEFTEFIRPICLWDRSEKSVEGQLGTVIGWGKDGTGNILSPEPKKIAIPVVSEVECLRSSDTYRTITSQRTFCAGGRDGQGPCNGDSGGAMAFKVNNKWMLRGIVSAALADPVTNSCDLGEYVVFTDVAKFISWIESNMR